ncbi:MAG: hypothetical protein HQL97_04315 [Magnetococcales bacterium]|nr:hypothetical protein [Magnetococcales bacterium]
MTHPDAPQASLTASLHWNPDGSGAFRLLTDGHGHWDGQGSGGWRDGSGVVAHWRADGSWWLTRGEQKWSGRADGAFEMKDPHVGTARADVAGNGQWVALSGAKGLWRADGSGLIQHADGAVESWSPFGGMVFITPEGVEHGPGDCQGGLFAHEDGAVVAFVEDGSVRLTDAGGDCWHYPPGHGGAWEGADGQRMRWDPEAGLVYTTPDGHRLVLDAEARLIWEEPGRTSWLNGDGRGGWIGAEGAWGVWESDGAAWHRDAEGRVIWRDGAGLIGWSLPDGARGGGDPQGGQWRVEGAHVWFSEGRFSREWEAVPGVGSGLAGSDEITLTHDSGLVEVWEPGIFTCQDPDESIGVWRADGSGSWSSRAGDLDTWDAEGRHQLLWADGTRVGWDRESGYAWHGAEGSWRVEVGQMAVSQIDPAALLAGDEGMRVRFGALRVVSWMIARRDRLVGRMHTVEERAAQEGGGGVGVMVVDAGLAQGDALFNRIRAMRRWLEILVRVRRLEHQWRRPVRRVG